MLNILQGRCFTTSHREVCFLSLLVLKKKDSERQILMVLVAKSTVSLGHVLCLPLLKGVNPWDFWSIFKVNPR